ncbi:MAG: SDR family oxidoreductase, partial [Gammaproteobacteria bacterium]
IVMTPLSRAELSGPHGDGYRQMIEACPAGRAGTADEVATVAALLLGQDGAFLTGSDILMDGGATAAFLYGDLELRSSSQQS